MVGLAREGLAASGPTMLCSDRLGIGLRSKREKAMTADLRVARRIDALFRALSTDFLLREQFVTDPAQIMAEYVTGSSLPEDAADVSNQMLYAVVSNGSLLRWMVRYARQHDGQPPTRPAFATDFADAVATYGDRQVVGALIRSAGKPEDFFEPASNLLLALISVLGPAQVREAAGPQDGQVGGPRTGNGKSTVGVFAERASGMPERWRQCWSRAERNRV